ncbi:Double C2-like domain-containing protein beta [Argiope bruennichi]|uniref:Double C2-like domain-containing protein beta n=1 Tax=Argiope bruennichi TaxID=94029 RepID=A0A8T0ERY6_ARGBR|nr:Double C2-like domain-containing protein beta [Argiope bruennichi]
MGDFGAVRDKWVCPNDRELSLRAKLKTGWSVKTNSINSFNKPEQLNDTEQEIIMSVIRRAETLDKVEQERIGRLVERLENMKKNAMGNGASQCVLCADEFGILGASPLVCNDCKKAVCTKCGVDTLSAHKEPICLCKICAETRETWKKSGAWFYKGLPKYILPVDNNDSTGVMTPPADSAQGPSPTHLYSPAMPDSPRSPQHRDDFNRSPGHEGYSPYSKQEKKVGEGERSQTPTATSSHWYKPSTKREAADQEDYSERQFRGHNRKESQHSPVSRYRPVTSSSRMEEMYEDKPVSPEESSTLEFSLLFDAHNQVLHCTVYRAKGLRPTDINGLADPFVRLQLLPVQSKDDTLASIFCPYFYRRRERFNLIRSLEFKNPPSGGQTVHKTLNPEFNEALSFYGISDYDIAKRTLKMTVMDEDTHCNEPMGEIRIALKRLKPQQPSYANVYLEKPRPDDTEEENSRGQILLALLYSDEHNALVVNIVRCVRLPSRENNGFPDPFVKVQLKPDAMRRRFKTSTKKKTLNPEYNEQYAFEMEPGELTKKTIEVTVWDKDCAKQDVYIGGLALNMQSKGDRLRHWLDIAQNSNRRIERWHPLSNVVFID